jgi:predicted MFS family arabinose efflux permease
MYISLMPLATTAFAIGVIAFSMPCTTIKSALRKLTDVFVVGIIIWAQTSGYDVLMIARVLATYACGIMMTMVQRSRSRLSNWRTAEILSKGFCLYRSHGITCSCSP